MAQYTENLGLHQWEPEDNFLRSDFNEDFGKIDAALGALETGSATRTELSQARQALEQLIAARSRMAVGYYSGNGGTTTINVGFKPRFVLIRNSGNSTSAFVVEGSSMHRVSLTSNGFIAVADNTSLNNLNNMYFYAAFS